jgi:uncharacterized membrane protein
MAGRSDQWTYWAWVDGLRTALGIVIPLLLLFGVLAALLSGVHVVSLMLVPLALLIAALSSPPVLVLLLVTILALHALVLTTATVLAAIRRPHQETPKPSLPPETILRRQYVAGTLTYEQFQTSMLDLLKQRCARGELSLAEYEVQVEHLLRPVRQFDVHHDPTLARRLHGS